MAYSSETLYWQSFKIEVRYDPDPFNIAQHGSEVMAHIEVRTLCPEGAALPITKTGYRSHFTPKSNLDDYQTVAEFIREWLEYAAQSEEWKRTQDEARQFNLF